MDGCLVTSVARTVFDVARVHSPSAAVAAADAALHRALCTPADLADVVARHHRTPGVHRARRVAGFADGRAESVGESYARVVFAQLGLPPPELQAEVFGIDGYRCARVDFDFPGMSTVAEFDGRVKYGALLRPGQTPSDVVFAEKIREDRIRQTGRQVVRVVWDDLRRPADILRRFAAAFAAAGRSDWRPGPGRLVDPVPRSMRGSAEPV